MKDEYKGIFLQKHQQGCLKIFYFMNRVKFQKMDPVFFDEIGRATPVMFPVVSYYKTGDSVIFIFKTNKNEKGEFWYSINHLQVHPFELISMNKCR